MHKQSQGPHSTVFCCADISGITVEFGAWIIRKIPAINMLRCNPETQCTCHLVQSKDKKTVGQGAQDNVQQDGVKGAIDQFDFYLAAAARFVKIEAAG